MQKIPDMMLRCPLRWRRSFLTLSGSLIGVVYLGGCVTWSPSESMDQAKVEETFADALRHCRLKEPGRRNRRLKTPATELHVRQCLESRGWLPNGTAVPNETDTAQTEAVDIER